mgnify:CR=1 FL=1
MASLNTAPILNDDKKTYLKTILINTILGGYKVNDPENGLDINGIGIIL